MLHCTKLINTTFCTYVKGRRFQSIQKRKNGDRFFSSITVGNRVTVSTVEKCLEQIAAATAIGERISKNPSIVELHGTDESHHAPVPPDAVIFPETTEEVAEVVRLANESEVPIIPFGAGTSLEGHISALRGGISLDLSRMDQVVEFNQEDMDCRVQAGVTRTMLNDYLHQTGLFFPIDPGADATIGGMSATRASGTNAVRYGTMRENILGLTVVTPQGKIIKTGGRARKSAAGYDLTRLYVGSEGTLGVITEVHLKLWGLPEAISSATCPFPDLHSAVNSVIAVIQCGIPVARVEMLDQTSIRMLNSYCQLTLPEAPTLFFEFHGSESSVTEQAEFAAELCKDNGAGEFQWATDPAERNRLWEARHKAYYAVIHSRPGCKGRPTDVCVPISRLADCIVETSEDIKNNNLTAPIFGHVGDGNFHVIFTHHPDDTKTQTDAVEKVNAEMVHRALQMGGTCTGEHGVGNGKMHHLLEEHGADSIELMKQIKMAMDPSNIMNPGKIFS